jgi:molecular chaperone HscB
METANHFQVLGLTPAYGLDTSSIKKQYLLLSRQWHPDFFSKASDPERTEAEEMSARLNLAWRTLSDPINRLEHLLELAGVGVQFGNLPQLTPLQLAELLELDEALENNAEPTSTAYLEFTERFTKLQSTLDAEGRHLDELSGAEREQQIKKVALLFAELKYLLRVAQKVPNFVAPAY